MKEGGRGGGEEGEGRGEGGGDRRKGEGESRPQAHVGSASSHRLHSFHGVHHEPGQDVRPAQ